MYVYIHVCILGTGMYACTIVHVCMMYVSIYACMCVLIVN